MIQAIVTTPYSGSCASGLCSDGPNYYLVQHGGSLTLTIKLWADAGETQPAAFNKDSVEAPAKPIFNK